MLLRRMIEHVRTQNWLAVFLDFVIVVVGVFIGIQLGNWNEAQADRKTEGIILVRLKSDFESIVETERHYLETVQAAQTGAEALLAAVAGGTLPDETPQLCALMNPPRAFRPAPPPSSTYEQLVANGDMQLIADEPLRVALAEFESQREQHVIIFDMNLQTALTLAGPFWNAVDICEASLNASDGRFADHVAEMVSTPAFAGAVSTILTQQKNGLRAHNATREQAEKVLALLQDAAD